MSSTHSIYGGTLSVSDLLPLANLPEVIELEKSIQRAYKKLHGLQDTYSKAHSVYEEVAQQSNSLLAVIRRNTMSSDDTSAAELIRDHPQHEAQIKASLGMLEYTQEEAEHYQVATENAVANLKMILGLWNIARLTDEGQQEKVRNLDVYRIFKRYSITNTHSK